MPQTLPASLLSLPLPGVFIWPCVSLKGSDVTQTMAHIRRYILGAEAYGQVLVSFRWAICVHKTVASRRGQRIGYQGFRHQVEFNTGLSENLGKVKPEKKQ